MSAKGAEGTQFVFHGVAGFGQLFASQIQPKRAINGPRLSAGVVAVGSYSHSAHAHHRTGVGEIRPGVLLDIDGSDIKRIEGGLDFGGLGGIGLATIPHQSAGRLVVYGDYFGNSIFAVF